MNSLFLPSSLFFPLSSCKFPPCLRLQPQNFCIDHHRNHSHRLFPLSNSFPFVSHHPLCAQQSPIGAAVPPKEGAVSVVNFDDLNEKDWSFLDSEEDLKSTKEFNEKIDRIISAGGIEETSKVLVSIGSEGFVDRLVDSSPCNLLLVVHDSLFVLVGIKEKYDKIKCWQGELIYVPEKWTPLDIVFLYFLPALPFKLDQVFEALAKRCLPGARVIVSHPQGREVLKQQQQQYPDVIISDLPNKTDLQKVATDHSFDIAEFVDEPGFYLAVLKFCEATTL